MLKCVETWNESLKLMDVGRYKEAEILMKGSLNLREKLLETSKPHNQEIQLETARYFLTLAYLEQCMNRPDEAEPMYRKYLPIQQKYAPFSQEYGVSLLNFAELLSSKELFEEAVTSAKASIEILTQINGKDEVVAGALSNLSGYLCAQKKYIEAKPYIEESYHLFLKLSGKMDLHTKTAFTNYYGVLVELGKLEEAKDLETDWKTLNDTTKTKDEGKISKEQLHAIKSSLEEKLGIKKKSPSFDMSNPEKFEKDMMEFITTVEEEKSKLDPTRGLNKNKKKKAGKSSKSGSQKEKNTNPKFTELTEEDEEILGKEWGATLKEIDDIEKEFSSVDNKVMNTLRQKFHDDMLKSQASKKKKRK